MKKVSSVAGLLSKEFIRQHALPSNTIYGKAIYKRGAVQVIESTDVFVEAWVGGLNGKVVEGGGSKRRVEFVVTKTGLEWHCTGNPKNHQIFCKHCVALALTLLEK